MIRRILTLALPMMAAIATAAPVKQPSVLSQTITDEAIIYPETFEQDTRKLLEGWYMKNYTATDDRYKNLSDVHASDDEIRRRLAAMPTVIEMPFNQIVRSYIDRYTSKSRPQVAALLGLSTYYMPIFEQALEAEGLPLELKYLPVIESGLDPNAVSRHGASGLWQFMLGTARGMNLEVSSLVDERREPYASSAAAARYLKDLYSAYGDWSLAIAAYNCGPGTVNKAIRRAGGDPKKQDFWSIYRFLPAETRGYVPMFVAANYVMNYYPEHNISPVLPTKPLVTDTIGVPYRVHLNQISEVLNIPKEELRVLNPQFRADVIPGSPERVYTLILPSQQVHAYIMSEDGIRNYQADLYARRTDAPVSGEAPADNATPLFADNAPENVNPADLEPAEEEAALEEARTVMARNDRAEKSKTEQTATPATPAPTSGKKHTVTHKVAAGESLADIAAKYQVFPQDLRRWNGLRRNAVRTGQLLRVETTVDVAAAAARPAQKTRQAQQTQPERTSVASSAPTQSKPSKTTRADQTVTAKQSTAKNSGYKSKKTSTSGRNGKNTKNNKAKQRPSKYTVSKGDNLSTIAKKHGVSVEALKKANAGAGDMLHPGDKLNIPSKKAYSSKSGSSRSKSGKNRKKSKKR